MNWRWIALSALLAAIVIGSGAYMNRSAAPLVNANTQGPPAYFLSDAVITETQPDGTPGIQVTATRIEQQNTSGTILLSDVRAHYFQVPGKEWALTADKGSLPADSRVLQLQGDVELHPLDQHVSMGLRTEALALDTEKQIAYSVNTPVTFQFGSNTMRANSFRADLKNEKLLARTVTGTLQPDAR
ncbi:MAG TPA: LPS export ABC transporter periplasmic protein LptC [Steroidobacteraceae bacterium]|nr:LPS export ABC transporter periplasmic protein LptC [Steroidobacteraceae bacterium]